MEILNYYPDANTYLNTVVSQYFALKTFLANLLLQGDEDRVVYARNSYALRAWAEKIHQDTNDSGTNVINLDLPFINIYISDISLDVDRNWFNYRQGYKGFYVPELKRNVKMLPIKVSFESTFFIKQPKDLFFSAYNLLFDAGGETNVTYDLNISGQDFCMPSVLNYNLNYEPEYTENDWLEKNMIRSIELNPTADTFFIKDTVANISKTLILTFRVKNNIDDNISDEEVVRLMSDDFIES